MAFRDEFKPFTPARWGQTVGNDCHFIVTETVTTFHSGGPMCPLNVITHPVRLRLRHLSCVRKIKLNWRVITEREICKIKSERKGRNEEFSNRNAPQRVACHR
ncbi:hypothetical protein EVAR_17246_1 [Eumeta japonica]|uniref:Uncharacterized protein n=1 Tax=Eumeta variegata TaxID=151549 RepID=A0A4C1TT05_EUMVA|nr:hypothetical protein EVAR_17246_1 [Eumeta japonica]